MRISYTEIYAMEDEAIEYLVAIDLAVNEIHEENTAELRAMKQ